MPLFCLGIRVTPVMSSKRPINIESFASMVSPALNEDIQSISFHNLRPLYLHWTIGPFIVLYSVWFYMWTAVYGTENYFEAGLIALAILAILQILTFLFCVWSVDVRCLMTCSKASRFVQTKKLNSSMHYFFHLHGNLGKVCRPYFLPYGQDKEISKQSKNSERALKA